MYVGVGKNRILQDGFWLYIENNKVRGNFRATQISVWQIFNTPAEMLFIKKGMLNNDFK